MAAEQDRPDVAARREEWRHTRESWDAERLVFLDETWAKTNLSRTHGRDPGGPTADRESTARALEDHDLSGRPADQWMGCPSGNRWRVERSVVPELCPAASCTGSPARRFPDPRQPRLAQGPWCPRSDRSGGRSCAVPAALQSRSQPDRTGVQQIAPTAPQPGDTHDRRSLAGLWNCPPSVLSNRNPELLPACRIPLHVGAARSSHLRPCLRRSVEIKGSRPAM